MKLSLTGGVLFSLLCTIKKEKISARETRQGNTDPASELEMMLSLWAIVQGHPFTLNKESLRTKLTNYKKCECNGSTLIPLEAKFGDDGESLNAGYYLVNKDATKKRIAVFIKTFIDSQNTKAIEAFVDTVNEIVDSDGSIFEHNSDNYLFAKIINDEETTISLDEYLFNVIYFVITSNSDNLKGKETLDYIQSEDYKPRLSNFEVKVNEISTELERNYIKELEEPKNAREGWEEYIQTLKNEFSQVKIYYDPDREYPFNKIYVPSSISSLDPYRIKNKYDIEYRIDSPTVNKIRAYARNVVISGVGGLGKTMLMRHLLLDAIDNNMEFVPVFVSVRSFTGEQETFMDYIFYQCAQYYPQLDKERLLKAFTSQQCILFLDGFDEIPFEHLQVFIRQYNKFIRLDLGNIIIMSSRPVGGAMPNHFTKIYILPFDFSQSCQLVDKLTAIQHNDVLGEKFKYELKTNLFCSHKDYAENPLLLTLMLRIYEQNASVPKEKFDFYYNAYEVLSHKHDALKEDGGYSRKYKTGLTPTEFANCFRKFCTYSLLLDGQVSFSESEMLKYYELIMKNAEDNWKFELHEFIYDATSSTGLMYLQGNRYIFIHRSIQEFFCAWYLSKQEDSVLYDIALQLQKHGKGLVWETLELLDERISYKMEKYVYLPYFNSIFDSKDVKRDVYKRFLIRFFNAIRYHHSSGFMVFGTEIEPSEALYYYCMKDRRHRVADNELGFPEYEAFQDEEIYDYFESEDKKTTGPESNMPCSYDTEKYGEPELVGHFYEFEMENVLANPEAHEEIINIIYDDQFPLYQEFILARKYWNELKEKYKEGESSTDLISLLH